MENSPDRRELLDLLDALCHDRLDEMRHERLQQLIRDDCESQRIYLDYIDTHLALKKILRPGGERDTLSSLFRDGRDPGPANVAPWRRPGRRLSLAGAAVVVVALGISAILLKGRPEREGEREAGGKEPGIRSAPARESAPRLVQSSGARFFGGRILPNGARLPFEEELALTEGLVELSFVDGASVILRAPAVFKVANRARLIVEMGRCSVHAPDGAQGFRVETPVGEVVDLGTRFSVDVTETGEAEVQVVEGLAEVHAGTSPNPIRLARGQAQKYSLDGKLSADDIRFDRSKYVSRLPDRIVTYEATERDGGRAETLLSVSVQRDGKIQTYRVDDLIGIDLIHYKVDPRGSIATGMDRTDPEQGDPRSRRRLDLLDRDAKLTTGVINPGKSMAPLEADPVLNDPEDPLHPNTPGFAVRFRTPVVNSPGPDVVLFDVQLIIDREKGDPFHVSPLHFAPGLKSHTIMDYDIDLLSAEARTLAGVRTYQFGTAIHALGELKRGRHNAGHETSVRTKALAVGIDLSNLGYRLGEAAEGLFFQAMPTERHPRAVVDPVFIAGLPPLVQPLARRTAR